MKILRRALLATAVSCIAVASYAQAGPQTGANLAAQCAADVLKDFAGADGAFIATGLVKETYDKDDLSSLLLYPTDGVVVLTLSGSQIRQAFERSITLYPQANSNFLQVSGFEITFSKSAPPDQRIVSVTVAKAPLETGRAYQIVMPASLGQGVLGYFKIWDKTKITKTFDGATLESVLKGKPYVETSPRWAIQP